MATAPIPSAVAIKPIEPPLTSKLMDMLATVNTVLGVVKTISETPGINMLPYMTTVSSAVNMMLLASKKGVDILPYVTALKDTFGGGVPTPEQLSALDSRIVELERRLNAPLPPKEDGEPE